MTWCPIVRPFFGRWLRCAWNKYPASLTILNASQLAEMYTYLRVLFWGEGLGVRWRPQAILHTLPKLESAATDISYYFTNCMFDISTAFILCESVQNEGEFLNSRCHHAPCTQRVCHDMIWKSTCVFVRLWGGFESWSLPFLTGFETVLIWQHHNSHSRRKRLLSSCLQPWMQGGGGSDCFSCCILIGAEGRLLQSGFCEVYVDICRYMH